MVIHRIVLVCTLLVWLAVIAHLIFQGRRAYNKGFCEECGEKLEKFTDTAGICDMYICQHCNRVVWTGLYIPRK